MATLYERLHAHAGRVDNFRLFNVTAAEAALLRDSLTHLPAYLQELNRRLEMLRHVSAMGPHGAALLVEDLRVAESNVVITMGRLQGLCRAVGVPLLQAPADYQRTQVGVPTSLDHPTPAESREMDAWVDAASMARPQDKGGA